MVTRSRGAAVLAAAALVAALGACQSGPGGPPTTGCTDETRTAGEPGDAEPLLVLGSAGLGPTIVYADGAVVMPVDEDHAGAAYLHLPMMMPGYHGDQPGAFEGGWLSDCELAAVIERADVLLTDDVDFGSPQVTDHGSTSVGYDGGTWSLYAFSRNDPTEWQDLSGAQKRARQDLADLWTIVEDSTHSTGELEIDRLFVHVYSSIEDGEVTDWPLDVPVSDISACLTVTEPAQVEGMLERLDDDSPLLEDQDWRLAVVAAAPGVPDCQD